MPLKLVVEVDGWLHDRVRDAARDAYMTALGIMVLRFTDQEIFENIDGVMQTIANEVWLLRNRS